MNKLKQITINKDNIESMADVVGDRDFLKTTQKVGRIFELNKIKEFKERAADSLVEIEIALRKCKRLGVFSKQ